MYFGVRSLNVKSGEMSEMEITRNLKKLSINLSPTLRTSLLRYTSWNVGLMRNQIPVPFTFPYCSVRDLRDRSCFPLLSFVLPAWFPDRKIFSCFSLLGSRFSETFLSFSAAWENKRNTNVSIPILRAVKQQFHIGFRLLLLLSRDALALSLRHHFIQTGLVYAAVLPTNDLILTWRVQ